VTDFERSEKTFNRTALSSFIETTRCAREPVTSFPVLTSSLSPLIFFTGNFAVKVLLTDLSPSVASIDRQYHQKFFMFF
jgi:hypothetical protein